MSRLKTLTNSRSSCEVSLVISCMPRSAFDLRFPSSRSTASRSSASVSGVTAASIRPSAKLYPDDNPAGGAVPAVDTGCWRVSYPTNLRKTRLYLTVCKLRRSGTFRLVNLSGRKLWRFGGKDLDVTLLGVSQMRRGRDDGF